MSNMFSKLRKNWKKFRNAKEYKYNDFNESSYSAIKPYIVHYIKY